jgi:hypothetical protein
VISRRPFLLAPAAWAWAQPRPPDVLVVWTSLRSIPPVVARESLVFPRAYAACPVPEQARRALESGKFPHAIRPGDPRLSYRQLTARTAEETARMALSPAPATIVVVTSAGGDGRDAPWESSIRVPLAVRYPGMIVARNAPAVLISHVDLMPTILALAGSPVPPGLHGRDLARLFAGQAGALPDSVYVAGGQWRAVVRGFDKLVVNLDEEVTGLYNLAEDPMEQVDLSRDPALELTRDSMLALARVWMRRLEDLRTESGAKLRR